MPRKSKNSQEVASVVEPSSPATDQETTVDKGLPRRRSTASKKPKPAQKKTSRRAKAKPPFAAEPAPGPDLTDQAIQLRAYFISERRRRFALPGDAESDWLEAKRQLLSESGPR